MLYHDWVNQNPDLGVMMAASEKGELAEDGLTNLNYTIVNITTFPLYTRIKVKLPGPTNKVRVFGYCKIN